MSRENCTVGFTLCARVRDHKDIESCGRRKDKHKLYEPNCSKLRLSLMIMRK